VSTIPAIGFVVFYVSDIEESVAYFTEKLGFKPVPEENSPIFRTLIGSDEQIGYGLNLVSQETPPAGSVELYFKTNDIDKLHAALVAKEAKAASIAQKPFGRIFSVQTPDRHALMVWQEPAG
jgi:catechol 2,3-dioxygenase-like lactoylglutathione lyase family enzyme